LVRSVRPCQALTDILMRSANAVSACSLRPMLVHRLDCWPAAVVVHPPALPFSLPLASHRRGLPRTPPCRSLGGAAVHQFVLPPLCVAPTIMYINHHEIEPIINPRSASHLCLQSNTSDSCLTTADGGRARRAARRTQNHADACPCCRPSRTRRCARRVRRGDGARRTRAVPWQTGSAGAAFAVPTSTPPARQNAERTSASRPALAASGTYASPNTSSQCRSTSRRASTPASGGCCGRRCVSMIL
jgi:hypothetical protein